MISSTNEFSVLCPSHLVHGSAEMECDVEFIEYDLSIGIWDVLAS